MPSAFVLMPFEQKFDDIYARFIRATLEEAGFSVKRADDLENQQNILRDIIGAIRAADLVVADLTSLNPNVFYELGVAHALTKRVILLSQNISEVPFDLRSYGIVIYSTQFAQFETDRQKFLSVAKGAAGDTLPFGSLFTDFVVETTGRPPSEVSQPDDRGFLDHYIAIEEATKDLTEVFQSVSVATKEIDAPTQELVQRVAGLRARGDLGSTAQLRHLFRSYSEKLSAYAQTLSTANERYEQVEQDIGDSLERIVARQAPDTDESRAKVAELISRLEETRGEAERARMTYQELRSAVDALKGVESGLNRGADATARELDRLSGNISKTIASIDRAIEIGRTKL